MKIIDEFLEYLKTNEKSDNTLKSYQYDLKSFANWFVKSTNERLVLYKVVMRCDPEEKEELITIIKQGSIISWRHINLLGTYDFNNLKKGDITANDAKQILAYKAA